MNEKVIQAGMLRHLISKCQFILMNHHFDAHTNESDVFAVYNSGYKYNFEIKTSLADFKADFKKATHRVYLSDDKLKLTQPFNRWFFVVPEGLVDKVKHLVPDYAGLLVAVPYLPDPEEVKSIKVAIKAPLIHKTKITDAEKTRLTKSLLWKYYRLIPERSLTGPLGIKTQVTMYFTDQKLLDKCSVAAKEDNRSLTSWLITAAKEKLARAE